MLARRGRDAEHPRRDLGRHRQRRRVRDARQAGHPRLHALAARAHEPVPAGADVLAAGRRTSTTSRSKGVFDDCQDLVKAVNADAAFKAQHRDRRGQLDQLGARRGAGRVLLQGLLRGHAQPTPSRSIFAVPSGNFGNICAGHVARAMGLPIRALILATNENDVLDEFFRTGRYRVRGAETHADLEPVDGHLQGVQLRALRVRPRRARRRAGARALAARSTRTASSTFALAYSRRVRRVGFVSGASTHADRLAHHPAGLRALRRDDRPAHRRRREGRARAPRAAACR